MFHHDPYTIRPKRGWAIVLQDKRRSILSSGLIIEETNAEKLHEGAGVIIRLGRGPRVEASGLQEGDRVMYRTYLRHAVPIEADRMWPMKNDAYPQKMEFFFMSIDDMVAVLPPDVSVGALSEKVTP